MVQDLGLRLLERQDNIRRGEEQTDAQRLALVAAGRPFAAVFPEYFPAPAPVAADTLDQEALFGAEDMPNEGGAFDYSQAALDMEQAEREIEMLARGLDDDRVTVTGDQPLKAGEWV